jgi:hypothetical protein
MIYAKYIMHRLFPVVRYVETVDCIMSVQNFNASVFIFKFCLAFITLFFFMQSRESINIVKNVCHWKKSHGIGVYLGKKFYLGMQ